MGAECQHALSCKAARIQAVWWLGGVRLSYFRFGRAALSLLIVMDGEEKGVEHA